MANKETSFDELILDQIPKQKYHQADFTSLPKDLKDFLGLLYPNPKDSIRYLISDYSDKITTSQLFSWIGVVKTCDQQGKDALLIQCQPAEGQDLDSTLLEEIATSFQILASALRPFFRMQIFTALSKSEVDKDAAILLAQGYFGSTFTDSSQGLSIAPVNHSWPAQLIWEKNLQSTPSP